MKIVLDTNVLIAAFISHGVCNELFEHCAIRHDIVPSPQILGDLHERLSGKFQFTAQESARVGALLRSHSQIVNPSPLSSSLSRDPEDDNIIAAAIAAGSRWIVTGDKDLLDLQEIMGISILAPHDFWEFESARGEE